MNRVALVIALLAAVVGGSALYLYKQRFEHEAVGGAPVSVLVARQDIPLGSKLTSEMLVSRRVPEAYVDGRTIQAGEASRVIGLPLRTRLQAGEELLWSDVAAATAEARDLAGLVQNGMRAVALSASPTSAFGGLLRPGDRVDVLLTTDRLGAESERVTVPLLQNLLVLAIGADVTGEGDRSRERRTTTVSVLVAPDQAQLLAFALDRGSVTLALRNPEDIEVVERLPETTANQLMRRADRPRSPAGAKLLEQLQAEIERVE
jgi:pilus assembly protein CpaB